MDTTTSSSWRDQESHGSRPSHRDGHGGVTGFVCYCPELRLYWYKVDHADNPEQGVDYKFNDDELEDSIATYMANDRNDEAEVMARITGLGRMHPHKFVVFDLETNEVGIEEPEDFWKKHDARRDGGG